MKQLTNDVITPLNWGKKIEAVRNRLGIHQSIQRIVSLYMVEENVVEKWDSNIHYYENITNSLSLFGNLG